MGIGSIPAGGAVDHKTRCVNDVKSHLDAITKAVEAYFERTTVSKDINEPQEVLIRSIAIERIAELAGKQKSMFSLTGNRSEKNLVSSEIHRLTEHLKHDDITSLGPLCISILNARVKKILVDGERTLTEIARRKRIDYQMTALLKLQEEYSMCKSQLAVINANKGLQIDAAARRD